MASVFSLRPSHSQWLKRERRLLSEREAAHRIDEDHKFDALPLVDSDAALSFALFAPVLVIVGLGTYAAILFFAAVASWIVLRRDEVGRILAARWFFLVFPAFAILSTIWSGSPFFTLKHALEYAVTVVAALLLSSPRNPRAMLFGIFAAFAVFTVISLMVGTEVSVGTDGTTAFSGLSDSKNQEADTAGAGLLVTTAFLWLTFRTRQWLRVSVVVAIGMLQAYELVVARSAGALAGVGLGVTLLCLLFVLRHAGSRSRAVLVGTFGVLALVVAVAVLVFTSDTLSSIAGTFGKDPTLTGRTYLWARAQDLVREQPVLGQGFAAFWQQGNLDAEGLWQFAHIQSREGFNFHNTAYDILVGLGWTGLILFGLTLIAGLSITAAGYVRNMSPLSSFWLAVGIYLLVRMPIETAGTYEFYFSTLLLFAMFGSSVGTAFVSEPVPHPAWAAPRSAAPAPGAAAAPATAARVAAR